MAGSGATSTTSGGGGGNPWEPSTIIDASWWINTVKIEDQGDIFAALDWTRAKNIKCANDLLTVLEKGVEFPNPPFGQDLLLLLEEKRKSVCKCHERVLLNFLYARANASLLMVFHRSPTSL